MNTTRNPPTVHPPIGAYSHQVEVGPGSVLVAIAGQVGRSLDGDVPEDPIEQVGLALENVKRNLEAAGMAISDIVKLNWYLVGDIDAQRRREALVSWLGGGHEPASTLVYVAALAAPQYRVEIEAWAAH